MLRRTIKNVLKKPSIWLLPYLSSTGDVHWVVRVPSTFQYINIPSLMSPFLYYLKYYFSAMLTSKRCWVCWRCSINSLFKFHKNCQHCCFMNYDRHIRQNCGILPNIDRSFVKLLTKPVQVVHGLVTEMIALVMVKLWVTAHDLGLGLSSHGNVYNRLSCTYDDSWLFCVFSNRSCLLFIIYWDFYEASLAEKITFFLKTFIFPSVTCIRYSRWPLRHNQK